MRVHRSSTPGAWLLASVGCLFVTAHADAQTASVKAAATAEVGSKLEVRRVSETDAFPQDNEWVQKEIQWKADLAEKLAVEARKAANR